MSEVQDPDLDDVLFGDEKPTKGKQGGPMTEERLALLARGRAARAVQVAEIRERRANGEITRYQQYKQGLLKIEDMDDEEIGRGKWKDLAGTFQGPNQRFAGPDVLAMRRELLKRGQRILEQNYQEAVKALTSIVSSPMSENKDRIKAISMIMERVAGKVPDKMEIGGADAFTDLLQDVIDQGVLQESDVIRGEIVEKD